MTEDETVGWHHQLNEYESEQTLGDSEGQGSLECCSPWGSQGIGCDLETEQQQIQSQAPCRGTEPTTCPPDSCFPCFSYNSLGHSPVGSRQCQLPGNMGLKRVSSLKRVLRL